MVLISSEKDLQVSRESKAEIYFQLPNAMNSELEKMVEIFKTNEKLIPWFPSVLITNNFDAAIEFLNRVKPHQIITNNSGVAFHAYREGIKWIAGPYLNMVNSYGLLCLKEEFNCAGSFISNELRHQQIRTIKRPENFQLFYSIYHPIVLMSSRQCLFHQITGCYKDRIDSSCLSSCAKHAPFTNLKKETFFIEKSKGNYNHIYNGENFLNTEILNDFPGMFSGFLFDLRNIQTNTQVPESKADLIQNFEDMLSGNPGSEKKLRQSVSHTTMQQYKKGI